jgi:hypothetical protein
MTQATDLTKLTNAELVDKYNELTGKAIKKFSSRAAGEKQVAAFMAAKGKTSDSKASPTKAKGKAQTKPAKPTKSDATTLVGQVKSIAKAKKEAKPATDRSAAISASWADPDVKAARSIKHHVKVAGVEHNSVHAAFKELGLPLNKVIKFRSELKANGKAEFGGHKFSLVAKA